MGQDADVTYLGLNHLSWITSVKKDGKEYIDRLFDEGFAPEVMANIHDDGFDISCLKAARGIPSSYLSITTTAPQSSSILKTRAEQSGGFMETGKL